MGNFDFPYTCSFFWGGVVATEKKRQENFYAKLKRGEIRWIFPGAWVILIFHIRVRSGRIDFSRNDAIISRISIWSPMILIFRTWAEQIFHQEGSDPVPSSVSRALRNQISLFPKGRRSTNRTWTFPTWLFHTQACHVHAAERFHAKVSPASQRAFRSQR